MKKTSRRIIAIFLAVMLCFTYVPPKAGRVEAAYSYNVEAAMAYAAAHWSDNDGSQCAEFVSRCVRAGGLNIPIKYFAIDCGNAVVSHTGINYQTLKLDGNGYATRALDGNILQRGDVVMQWCPNCIDSAGNQGRAPHIVICAGYDSAGYAVYYGHNNALNGRLRLNDNPLHRYSRCRVEGKVIHISNQGNTVAPKPFCGTPSISVSDIRGGKFLQIKGGQSDMVNYSIYKDGVAYRTNKAGGAYDEELFTPGKYTVSAYATRSGYNNSGTKKVIFTVSRAATPGVSMSMTDNNVILDIKSATDGATIYYTTNGSEPNIASNKYSGALSFDSNRTVKAIAAKNGFVNSEVMTYDVKVQEPDAPTGFSIVDDGNLDSDNKIAVGKQVGVKWDKMPMTSEYVVSLYKDGEKIKSSSTTGTTMSFTLDTVGKYEIHLYASNFVGNSEEAYPPVSVEAMAPSSVRFEDDDGKLIKEQEVAYGESAELPGDPERRGYTFVSWDNISAAEKVTKDVIIKATYKINTYSIKFYDASGKQVGSTQKVQFGDSAKSPESELTDIPTGYVFAGWKVLESANDSTNDYKEVDSDMKLQAVYYWGNDELPVVTEIQSATRNSSTGNYNVKVKLTNFPKQATTAILRVSLLTKDGKMVKTGKSEIEIPADQNIEENITLKYSGAASKASVVLLGLNGNDMTGSAYSKEVTKEVTEQSDTVWSDWSEWETTPVDETDDIEIEKRTEYRYKDKEVTTSTAASLDGWTKYDSKTTYGNWGSWSGYSPTVQTKSDVKDVETHVYWRYFYYQCPVCGRQEPLAGWSDCGKYQLTSANIHYDWLPDAYQFVGPKSFSYTSKVKYTDTYVGDGKTRCFAAGNLYSMDPGTKDVNTGEVIIKTYYRYRTRTKTVTNYFYKWNDWSDWSDTEATASDNKEVETRTVYRSRKKVPVYSELAGEEETGKNYEFSGNLSFVDADINGKLATIMVYKGKNTDPNEDQIQYVGQTTIGEENSYSFTVTPKSEPTDITGDFTVCLGLEGSTGLVMIGRIDAPKATYIVKYVDDDGNIISEQEVKAGDNAVVPESPSKNGYIFVGWNSNAMNIQENMTIGAVYAPLQYSVAFVDGANNVISFENYHYGDKLIPPEDPTADGRKFKGWDLILDGQDLVTGNAVVNAVYETNIYVVDFVDENDKSINKQLVEYGKSAMPPVGIEVEGKEFMGWSTSEEWWNVTKDMTVKPILALADTVDSPVAEFYQSENEVAVILDSSTLDADIYYMLTESKNAETVSVAAMSVNEDGGNNPNVEEYSYGEPVKYDGTPVILNNLEEDSYEDEDREVIVHTIKGRIKTFAVCNNMNDSDVQEMVYESQYETPLHPINEYTVTLDVNGGDALDTEVIFVTEGDIIGDIPDATREGYDFDGWYTDKEAGEKITSDYVVSESLKLYAHWKTQGVEKANVTITFDTNGGETLKNSEVKLDKGEKIGALPTLEREGFTFEGWYTDKEAGTVITEDYVVEEEVTFYAHWKEIIISEYTVESDANGGDETEEKTRNVNESLSADNASAAKPQKTNDGYYVISTLKEVDVQDGIKVYDEKTGIKIQVISTADKTVRYIAGKKDASSVAVPAMIAIAGEKYKITSIAAKAFKNNKKLTKVSTGKYVTEIGDEAFSGCKKLKKVTFGSKLTTIGNKAFYKNTSLRSIIVPAKVAKIGKSAFCGCSNLKTIVIKTTKLFDKSVGAQAFKNIHKKATVKVPKAKLGKYKRVLKKKGISGKTQKIKK